jgi:hypothetical protein
MAAATHGKRRRSAHCSVIVAPANLLRIRDSWQDLAGTPRPQAVQIEPGMARGKMPASDDRQLNG